MPRQILEPFMMRMLGLVLLVGSVLLIAATLVRFGSSTVARAREGERGGRPSTEPQAVLEVSDRLARTVKYLVAPAALLLVGGVLLRSARRDERIHELHVDVDEKQG